MVGTTSLANKLLAILPLALAAFATTSYGDPRDEPITTGEAFQLSLEGIDVQRLAEGMLKGPLRDPIQGRHDDRISQDYWFATVGVQGIAYSFRISGLNISTQDGHLHADVRIEDLFVNVEWLTFNESGSMYCRDTPIWSGAGAVPAWADVAMSPADRQLNLGVFNQGVGLSDDNFIFGEPAECDTIWGFNWLVRRIVPWLGSLARDRIAEGVANAIANSAKSLGQQMNQFLSVNITWPFDIQPAPAFYATFALWPSAAASDGERFKMTMGADVLFDPDQERFVMARARDQWSETLFASSYVGLGRPLVAAIVTEANRKGLFSFDINPKTLPGGADILRASALSMLLPDAASRFGDEEPVNVRPLKASATEVRFDPNGPGGHPIIEMLLSEVPLKVSVSEHAYYDAVVDAKLTFDFGYDLATNRVGLAFRDFEMDYKSGGFDPGLSPAPIDTSMNAGVFQALSRLIAERVSSNGRSMFSLELPAIVIGDRHVKVGGASVRGDYVTLDAVIP